MKGLAVGEEVAGQRLTSLEIASCVVVGLAGSSPPAACEAPVADPVTAFERVAARALQRPPCLVSFSGGHDSSLVLAAATRVAHREHLPMPVPVTWRVTGAPGAEESACQEAVVAALGITDWIRLAADDDLDFVGPVATGVLRRHGLLHPANAYFHAPLLSQAAGGTLLTGVGGDQVLGPLGGPGGRGGGRAGPAGTTVPLAAPRGSPPRRAWTPARAAGQARSLRESPRLGDGAT